MNAAVSANFARGCCQSKSFELRPKKSPKYLTTSETCNCNQLKQPFASNFSKPEPWTRIRATIRARAIVSCLSYAHARRRPCGATALTLATRFQVGGPLFLKRFSEWFFRKNDAKWSPIWH